jgi:serine/threonine-protein kinase
MLIYEAKLAAKLNHANIVQVFDLGRVARSPSEAVSRSPSEARDRLPRRRREEPDENDGAPGRRREEPDEDGELFIAMEYVEGFDLNALLRRCTEKKVPLPFEFALRIVCDVLRGLDYAHRCTDEDGKPLGIVHRDVSPSNVLVSFEGEVKLCDFGIAHANDLVQPAVGQVEEAIKGKAGYMSPEHARGEPIDRRADVFATGILLWELVAGHRLYRSKSPVPLLEQARRAEIPPLPERGLPGEARLREIVARALAPDREARFNSAAAFLRELESYMGEARFGSSILRLGEWIVESFGMDVVSERRERERKVAESTGEATGGERPERGDGAQETGDATPRSDTHRQAAASGLKSPTSPLTPTPTPPLLPPITPEPPPVPAKELPVAPPSASSDRSSIDLAGVDVSPPSKALDHAPAPAPKPRAARAVAIAILLLMTIAIVWSIARR